MAPPFAKILVANRGEIAVRVLRCCREMGIASVAVVSEPDRRSRHAHLADEVVAIGPAAAGESYLRADRIVAAAVAAGAEAVHPGYGFLAENADFARACAEAGLVFIGPPPDVIEAMGEKTAARRMMSAAGVPVVPGAELPDPGAGGGDSGGGEGFDPETVLAVAREVGAPLLVKAVCGGGGKGMRLVGSVEEAPDAAAAAAREARQAFGDGRVYIERCLSRPRHVEFQILADAAGAVVHLGERECSIQRRHQKIIEETPSPALDAALREEMGNAAVAAAKACGYVGAGTVEFLLDPDGAFYFLEMNTRLQVEHPVTEMATGLDLVRAQIEIAAGRPLPWTQAGIAPRGWAIECRICAEEPQHGFRPAVGPVLLYREPSGPGVRVDSGIAEGDEVGAHYDPLLAKLIVHAADRDAAIDRARDALREFAVLGVATNGEYLADVLDHPAFRAGQTDTAFLAEHLAGWAPAAGGSGAPERTAAMVAAGLHDEQRAAGPAEDAFAGPAAGRPASAWSRIGRFRLRGLD